MTILNWKQPFDLYGLYIYFSAVMVKGLRLLLFCTCTQQIRDASGLGLFFIILFFLAFDQYI